ncbi:hypothetical protein JHL18_08640 [Clostridium sp. YIM B02505]|uniref:SHOCT domain-containing protein n=1 Tax=Clostridium yunnanense TaxID=2800325 RepID=A0ABS1EN49_9CLOT|nr:hypothetical protein [Clostridium yunnanense]MBK1810703.1 hypothetical protein [Clostridium yunnanense]
MDLNTLLLWAAMLFLIIFAAVRLAISPLIEKKYIIDQESRDLVKLRDIDVLSDSELEEIIEFYQKKNLKNKDYEQYQKYSSALKELKEIGYFSEEKYSNKMDILNDYFKID